MKYLLRDTVLLVKASQSARHETRQLDETWTETHRATHTVCIFLQILSLTYEHTQHKLLKTPATDKE